MNVYLETSKQIAVATLSSGSYIVLGRHAAETMNRDATLTVRMQNIQNIVQGSQQDSDAHTKQLKIRND